MKKTISNRLIRKIMFTFILLIVLIGVVYTVITFYFTRKYFEETTQKLNARVADHLINEKFKNASPFLEDGSVNKPLFGDIMHDMMAVNRGIEVYLLDRQGNVRYSVVLDHSDSNGPAASIDVAPIKEFIKNGKNTYILGENPRNPEERKIFSAAEFNIKGNSGYIYIILAGERFEEVTSGLFGSYFLRMGTGVVLGTVLFAGFLGLISIWYITQSLRDIIKTVRRFQEGDLNSRVEKPEKNDLILLAETFNEMADTLVANMEELKSVESLRRELIANVSHDLRTPLSIMQGYVETLQIKKGELTSTDRQKYLGIVQNSIEKLSTLINQLFEYSKLEAKQVEPQKEPFPISDLAHEVYEKYQKLAESRSIDIQLNIQKGLPMVFADISLVERVIQNLMDNALKYTPENGCVSIEITYDLKDVFVSIKDTGPGIPVDEVSHIFERYKRARQSKDKTSGTGLGLAIAKKIIELHKSTIKVISPGEKGTEIRFNLPLHTAG